MAQVTQGRERLATGVIAAVLTPLRADGSADIALLAAHCRALLTQGCTAIVLLGTTGEANSFTTGERQTILEQLVGLGVSPADLIVGTGCCAHGDTVALTRHALSMGVQRVLMLPPFYYKKVTDDGIFASFATAIDAVGDPALRVYLYLIPQLSGVEISPALIERLSQAYGVRIAGLKDSSGNWPAIEQLCRTLSERIDVLVGSETLLLRAMQAGATGCVSATANVNAAGIVALYRSWRAPDADLEAKINATRAVFERYPVVPGLKAFLASSTGNARWNNVRPPLCPLSGADSMSLLGSLHL
jgi:4-hydroxy-tetrahydrodipicolinate synthase